MLAFLKKIAYYGGVKFLKQSFLIILSFLFVFIWQKTQASNYTIQVILFFILLYVLISARKKEFNLFNKDTEMLSIFILITSVFLFVISTGGLTSGVFFLLYFLLFGITFALEPAIVFVFVLGSILFFLPNIIQNNVTDNIIRVGTFAIASPLAFFFGREVKKEEKDVNKKKKK